jgi:predicted RNA-binding protein YlxR (DUF448 family)
MPTRHIPERTCVICGTKTSKRDLVRLVRTPDGESVVDETGKRTGRGAYLCHRDSCWDRALNTGRLSHALHGSVSDQDKEKLSSYRQQMPKAPEPTSR